jgi:putative sugar O-methyltransferase
MIVNFLNEKIEVFRQSRIYKDYLEIRDDVLKILEEVERCNDSPSKYWIEEIEAIDYIFDASPLIVNKLREHTHHITGIKSYEYRDHHAHQAAAFEKKLKLLQQIDPWGLFIPEAKNLGGFGHKLEAGLVNLDTLKFYETLIGMEISNCFSEIRGKKSLILEIGAGWGGFAYQFKRNFPLSTYLIVDLPAMIIFSYTYLKSCFPDAKFKVVKNESEIPSAQDYINFDFVFIPNFLFEHLNLPLIDLGINMVSFQEMTEAQVMSYLKKLTQLGCRRFYSHNRDRSKHNQEISAVGICMKHYFSIQEINVLDWQYTDLKMKPIDERRTNKKNIHDYRHIMGLS